MGDCRDQNLMSKSATLIKATGQQIHATRIVQMLGHIFQPTPQHPCFRAVQEDMIRGLQLAFTEAAPRNNHAPSLQRQIKSSSFPTYCGQNQSQIGCLERLAVIYNGESTTCQFCDK